MFSYESLPPPKTILTAAASLAASALLFRTITADLIPSDIHDYFTSSFKTFFKRISAHLTVVIHDSDGLTPNQLFEAVNLYLGTNISPSIYKINVNKPENDNEFSITVDPNQHIFDVFQTVKCKWVLHTKQIPVSVQTPNARSEVKFFELSFHKKHKETVLKKYLPHILKKAKEIKDERKAVKLHTVDFRYSYYTDYWSSVALNHPATFETIAMDQSKKTEIIEDLDVFIKSKEYYRSVGRAWKRGYLLYGPPGTGKSSLVAAMANHLRFDVYDLDLREVEHVAELRKLLIGIKTRSIIVIEDIDCNVALQSREFDNEHSNNGEDKINLSWMLNFIDGLWSSCGEERIIVFTTNHKERLDAALLRPGRMDVHIEMSYCTYDVFKALASTYLQVKEDENLQVYGVIKQVLNRVKVTPSEIAGELMKSENVEFVLTTLIHWLQIKEAEQFMDGENTQTRWENQKPEKYRAGRSMRFRGRGRGRRRR